MNELDKTIAHLEDSFQHAATPNDLYTVIDNIDSTIAHIDNDLETYINLKQPKFQQDITNIELMRTTRLSSTISHSTELSSLFQIATDLGHSLTFKIKSLDQEIGNVNTTLEYVKNVQLLKNNIDQANYAIDHHNWELAAQCIHTISQLPSELIKGKFASVVVPSQEIPELPERTIHNWIEQLTVVFKEKFNVAAEAKDVEQLTKYFQLFPLLGQEEIGLNCYSKFICEIIKETARALISQAGSNKPGVFSDITIQLFESISMMLSQHGPLIKRYYRDYTNALTYVITKIQREIDVQIGIISDTFYDVRRMDKLFQDIGLYKFTRLEVADDEEVEPVFEDDLIPIRQVGDIISELASILHHWSLYCKFITGKYFPGRTLPEVIIKSNFTRKINDKLLPAFEILYKFYFRRSLEKAITIEELPQLETYLKASGVPPDQVPCSSVIEDLTLVLNSTLHNVIESGMPTSVKTFINESFRVIQIDLINGFFINRLNDNTPRYNQVLSLITPDMITSTTGAIGSPQLGTPRSSTPEPSSIGFLKGASSALGSVVASSVGSTVNNPKLLNFIIYLNTVAMAQQYFTKVIGNINIQSNFPFGKDKEKISSILHQDFLDPFINISNKIISESLLNLYNQSIKSKLVNLVNEFLVETNDNYIIHSTSDLNDSTNLLKFTNNWQGLIHPYIQTLHHELIYPKLLRLILVNIVNLIEKKLISILNKFKINEFGAIKLERDLSYLINQVCQDNYQLREKFVKITQIVLLVGMDDEEYDESNQPGVGVDDDVVGINWVLTPSERNQIRKYRI
ncbi:Conserved oligomeric Golgi complex subunit 4 [Spathaspora sp. JA1]|nr:Conserved oligomeric Golgi complex subunit 4 [Spathaspora sp. JA1]